MKRVTSSISWVVDSDQRRQENRFSEITLERILFSKTYFKIKKCQVFCKKKLFTGLQGFTAHYLYYDDNCRDLKCPSFTPPPPVILMLPYLNRLNHPSSRRVTTSWPKGSVTSGCWLQTKKLKENGCGEINLFTKASE